MYLWCWELQSWPYNNLGMDEWIFMKFGMEIMPLEPGPQQ